MEQEKQTLREFLASEVKKYKGVAVPVRTGFLKRKLIKQLPCRKLHPNPDDEFTFPEIGPNDGIISDYVEHIRTCQNYGMPIFDEPLIVQQIRPDGYMLLNGHHRWAAAMKMGIRKVPVEIVNLTQAVDIKKMLKNSKNHMRATLDLDEVVFRPSRDELTEKPQSVFFRRRYPEHLRLGIPGLFSYLNLHGYDIWVYSANYYSLEHIRRLFLLYHVNVTGIVTGTGRKSKDPSMKKMDSMIAEQYPVTVNIDEKSVVRIENNNFDEYQVADSGAGWSAAVMDIIEKMKK